ncbi:hypothetical protein ACP70R_016268 [Stipagrostis hirtigluma subsp. patula]
MLYEVSGMVDAQPMIVHTSEFTFLHKAVAGDKEEGAALAAHAKCLLNCCRQWRRCFRHCEQRLTSSVRGLA